MLNKWFAEGIAIVLFLVLLSGLVFGQTCSGTCTACSTYSAQGTCEAQAGCAWNNCTGTPSACSTWNGDQSGCTSHGCNWNSKKQKCIGSPDACSTWDGDEDTCTSGGCAWGGVCSGTCTACSTYSAQGTCEAQAGCSWEAAAAECGNNTKETGETCDGTDLDSETCVTQGYDSGDLACQVDCSAFDVSSCVSDAVCGDEVQEAPEVCDGDDLDSETCVSQGFDSGDLACNVGCSAFDTSSCVSDAVCGDNSKEGSEACDGSDLDSETCVTQGYVSGDLACESDCSAFDTSGCTGTGPVCGNNEKEGSEVCDGTDLDTETCVSKGYTGGALACEADCASFVTTNCTGTPTTGECVTNCCGDRLCEESNDEDYGTCRVDCPSPAKLFFTFYSPGEGQTFSRGERVLVKVGLKADSITPFSSAVEWFKVSSPGIFGTIDLFDDGEHDDGKANDGVYAKSFLVRIDANTGEKTLTVEAKVVNTQQGTKKTFTVDPTLGIGLVPDKNTYTLGDLIEVNGFIRRGDLAVRAPFDFNIAFGGNSLFDWNSLSYEDGSYDVKFQTTTISPTGEWILSLYAEDEFENKGIFSKKIGVFESKPFSALSISLVEPLKESVERGDQIKFTVNVLDEYSEFVKNAVIDLVTPSGETVRLERGAGLFYTEIYSVPWNAPAGEQAFEVKAFKKTDYSVQRGQESFGVEIKPAQINLELLNPKSVEFAAGETIDFQVRLTYPSGRLVTEPVVNALVNQKPVSLIAVEKGIYATSYPVSPLDSGRLIFSISVEDQFANAGTEEYELYVSGISWLYWVKAFPSTIGFFLFAFFLAVVIVFLIRARGKSISSLRKRKRELEALRRDTQNRYYKLNVINRETYNKLRGKHDTELEGVNQEIKELERKARKGK